MATLKDHQQAMVDLLASGSGIPASASRLAHAMHDVLSVVMGRAVEDGMQQSRDFAERLANDATTPGLNDKALAADVEACRPKDTMFDRAVAAERRVKELENTVKQLRANNAKLKDTNGIMARENARLEEALVWHEKRQMPEQAGCRKEDTQLPDDGWIEWKGGECPIEDRTWIVEIKFRDGETDKRHAGGYRWVHYGKYNDIIAYRIVGDAK